MESGIKMIRINKRNIGMCILLSIITCGLYNIYWTYLLMKNTRSIQNNTESCLGEMICMIFVPFYSLYWWYTRGKIVEQHFKQHNYASKSNGLLYLILGFFGLAIVSMAVMQSDFNSLNAENYLEYENKVVKFLKKKDIEFSFKRYFIDALGAMAQGLFASLLIGTIISTIGTQFDIPTLVEVGNYAKSAQGAAMAIAIGFALKCPPLVLFSLAAVGVAANTLGGAGGPLAVLFAAIVGAEFGKLVSKETKIDIIVTPFVTIFTGVVFSMLCAPYIGKAATEVGKAIMWATELQPFLMGIIVSVIVGIALTLPISSAAICAALSLTGLAGGAALAGCCANMVGFAVMSFKENRWGGLFAQGIGTSMLQMGNIVKNPRIWIPPIIASAITGPIATCIFELEMNGAAVSSGMGTCGLVGQIGTIEGWFATGTTVTPMHWIGLIAISFVLPAILTPLIAWPLRKIGWIKENDLKLDL